MTLIGRDSELAVLRAVFRDCADGSGTAVLVQGPVAGGKSALLREFIAFAVTEGATCLSAIAAPAERGLPMGVVGQLFPNDPLPEFLTSVGLDGTSGITPAMARAFERLRSGLMHPGSGLPVVITVDDLHHADVASWHFLSYLARRSGSAPIMLVLAESMHTLPADRQVRAEIVRQARCCVVLRPLSPAGVAGLLGRYLTPAAAERLASAAHALAGGSPHLVHALAQDTRSAGGPTAHWLDPRDAFRQAVVSCLHRHEPTTVQLGQAVAILAEDEPRELIEVLLGTCPESAGRAWAALAGSGLLDAGHFRHPVARQAVLDHLTRAECESWHADVAYAQYRAGAAATTIARHLLASRPAGARWRVPLLHEAADVALADGDTTRAVGYLQRCEAEIDDERQRAVTGFALVRAQWPVDPESAVRRLDALVAAARRGNLNRWCQRELAHHLLWTGNHGAAAEMLGPPDFLAFAGSLVPEAPPSDTGFPAGSLARRSPLAFLYPGLAGRDFGQPLPVAELTGDPTRAAAERIIAEHSLADPTLASVTATLVALVADEALDQATGWCAMLLGECETAGAGPLWRAVLTSVRALAELRRGDLPAAENDAHTALALLSPATWGVAIGVPLSTLVLAATARHDREAAAAALRVPVPEAMRETVFGLLHLYAEAEHQLATGSAAAALAGFTACGTRMTDWELDLPGLVPWRGRAAEAHLALGDEGSARGLAREQLARAAVRFLWARGTALRVLALACPLPERLTLLGQAVDLLREAGARSELAVTLAELARACLAAGDTGRARRTGRQARDLACQCGLPMPATGLDQEGTRPEEPAGLGVPLSEAERRVAALAASGHTNVQIAHRLFVTVSTVEQHLTRVYRKLGVTGRADLPPGIWLPVIGARRIGSAATAAPC
jgi:DNA-binding CsgD family transcriptional regulator